MACITTFIMSTSEQIHWIKKRGRSQSPGCNMDRYAAPAGALWLISQVLGIFSRMQVMDVNKKEGALRSSP